MSRIEANLKADGIAKLYGVTGVKDSASGNLGVMLWLDFTQPDRNYRLVISIEDAKYLRDHLDEMLEN